MDDKLALRHARISPYPKLILRWTVCDWEWDFLDRVANPRPQRDPNHRGESNLYRRQDGIPHHHRRYVTGIFDEEKSSTD